MIIKAQIFQSGYTRFHKVFNIRVLNNKNFVTNTVQL